MKPTLRRLRRARRGRMQRERAGLIQKENPHALAIAELRKQMKPHSAFNRTYLAHEIHLLQSGIRPKRYQLVPAKSPIDFDTHPTIDELIKIGTRQRIPTHRKSAVESFLKKHELNKPMKLRNFYMGALNAFRELEKNLLEIQHRTEIGHMIGDEPYALNAGRIKMTDVFVIGTFRNEQGHLVFMVTIHEGSDTFIPWQTGPK